MLLTNEYFKKCTFELTKIKKVSFILNLRIFKAILVTMQKFGTKIKNNIKKQVIVIVNSKSALLKLQCGA